MLPRWTLYEIQAQIMNLRLFAIQHEMCLYKLWIVSLVNIMLLRDINTVLRISIAKVLTVLKSGNYKIISRFSHYDCLETDEFWTYVGKKKSKVWLIYTYHRESGEMVASNRRFAVWGKGT
jgi:hypothetical protein